MTICEICKKEKADWGKNNTYQLMFVYHIKTDDKDHVICPKCTLKRLKQLAESENKDE